jgi:hypothetical protein
MDLESIIPRSNDPDIVEQMDKELDEMNERRENNEKYRTNNSDTSHRKHRHRRHHRDYSDDDNDGTDDEFDSDNASRRRNSREKFPRDDDEYSDCERIEDDSDGIVSEEDVDLSDVEENIRYKHRRRRQKSDDKSTTQQPNFQYSPQTGMLMEDPYADMKIEEQQRDSTKSIIIVVSIVILVLITLFVIYKLIMKWDEKKMIAEAERTMNQTMYGTRINKQPLDNINNDDEYTNVNEVIEEDPDVAFDIDKEVRGMRISKKKPMTGGSKCVQKQNENKSNTIKRDNVKQTNVSKSSSETTSTETSEKPQPKRIPPWFRRGNKNKKPEPKPSVPARDSRGRFVKRS